MSAHMIPSTSKTSSPSSPVLKTHLTILNEIDASSSAETPSPPPLPTEKQPPVANTEATDEASNSSVYAAIKIKQTTKQPTTAGKKNDDPKYAVINLP